MISGVEPLQPVIFERETIAWVMTSPTSNTIIRKSGLLILAIVVSYLLAVGWWWLWMCRGWVGPVPFLHWFIWSDGEASYGLTLNEMWITAFAFLIIVRLGTVLFQRTK